MRRNLIPILTAGVLGGGKAKSYPLDNVENVALALSATRRLLTSYKGNLITLRRSSDNAELGFGVDSNGDLDTSAISIWLAGADAYVKTIHDQSGNGFDRTQTVSGNQAQLILSGLGGKPSIRHVAANKHYYNVGTAMGKLSNYTTFTVFFTTNIGASQILHGSMDSSGHAYSTNDLLQVFRNSVSGGIGYAFGNGTLFSDGNTQQNSLVANTKSLVCKKHTNGDNYEDVYRDGQKLIITKTATNTTDSGSGAAQNLSIGRGGDLDLLYFGGDWSEHIVVSSVLDEITQRNIETSACNYYGIQLLLVNQTGQSINAAGAQTTPTYDGSNDAVHPSVFDAGSGNVWPASGSPQYRYWMTMTPYPGSDAAFENPSILGSTDGAAWEVPSGVTNPIIAAPGSGHNADTELLHAQDDKLYMYFMRRIASTSSKIIVVSSSDGVTWSSENELLNGDDLEYASPAVVWDGSQYVMWYTDVRSSPYKLLRRTCATPDGTWSASIECTTPIPAGWSKDLWHQSVVLDGGMYYMFQTLCDVTTQGANTILWLYRSSDGLIWYPDATPLLLPSVGWDNLIYRASGIKTVSGFDLWYSAKASGGAWKIGKTTVTL